MKAELLCPDITIEPVVSLTYPRRGRRRRRLGGTRKLSVLLRIKISGKSYGRLQTNRAVAFPTGCRNFRSLSTFPTALATTSSIPPPPVPNTSFYALPSTNGDDLQSKAIMLLFFFSSFRRYLIRFLLYGPSGRINSTHEFSPCGKLPRNISIIIGVLTRAKLRNL